MFADPGQIDGFRSLMSKDDKPFECVGERRESAVAVRLLSRRPGWAGSPVITALAPMAEALVSDRDVDELFAPDPTVGMGIGDIEGLVARLIEAGAPHGPEPAVRLESLVSRRVAIWGMGEEGTAFARLLIERGAPPVLVDDDPVAAARRVPAVIGTPLVVHPPEPSVLGGVDVIVRSPGVSRYRPELVEAARRWSGGDHAAGRVARGLPRRPGRWP